MHGARVPGHARASRVIKMRVRAPECSRSARDAVAHNRHRDGPRPRKSEGCDGGIARPITDRNVGRMRSSRADVGRPSSLIVRHAPTDFRSRYGTLTSGAVMHGVACSSRAPSAVALWRMSQGLPLQVTQDLAEDKVMRTTASRGVRKNASVCCARTSSMHVMPARESQVVCDGTTLLVLANQRPWSSLPPGPARRWRGARGQKGRAPPAMHTCVTCAGLCCGMCCLVCSFHTRSHMVHQSRRCGKAELSVGPSAGCLRASWPCGAHHEQHQATTVPVCAGCVRCLRQSYYPFPVQLSPGGVI